MTLIGSADPEIAGAAVARTAHTMLAGLSVLASVPVGARVLAKPASRNRTVVLAALLLCTTALTSPLASVQCAQSAVPIQRVQQASATAGTVASSLSLAWPAPTADGNFLALAVHVDWSSTVGDILVPAGWTLAERADNVGFRNVTVVLYYRESAPSQSGTVTVSTPEPADEMMMVLAEYRGIRASGSLDKHARSVGTSATPASGSTAPTTQPDELWLGAIASSSGFSQCDPTNDFVEVAMSASGASTLVLYDRVAASSGPAGVSVTLRPSFSCSTTETIPLPWAGVVASFRAATPQAPEACAPIHLENCFVTTRFVGTPYRDRYNVRCRVRLDGTSNGIDPVAEGIHFVLTDQDSPTCTGPCLATTVTPRRVGRCWRYNAGPTLPLAIRSLRLCDIDPPRGVYQLVARSHRANLQCLNGPAPYMVGLTIGDDCSGPCSTTTTTVPVNTTTTTLPLPSPVARFTYTGAPQIFQVPTDVTSIVVKAWGAGGGGRCGWGGGEGSHGGGGGGFAQARIPVVPGETLTIIVGGGGGGFSWNTGSAGGFGGGGDGGDSTWAGFGGGGRSEVARGSESIVVAGGGGGAGDRCSGAGHGGAGGDGSGAAAASGTPTGGTGGSTEAGGAVGLGGSGGTDGTRGQGGRGQSGGDGGGGDGGGGYFGGGGGGAGTDVGAGGGGGSSFATGDDPLLVEGDRWLAGNASDPDYVAPVGQGGQYDGPQAGQPGLVVIRYGGSQTPSSWTRSDFQSASSVQTPCQGARYVKYLPTYGKWVGVSLCSPIRYKIYLGDDAGRIFYEIGDYAGHGQDHCELVNPDFRIPDEDDITSGGCTVCSIDTAHVFSPPVGSQGWSRARYGEPFRFESSWPMYNLYTAQWYECGVTIP